MNCSQFQQIQVKKRLLKTHLEPFASRGKLNLLYSFYFVWKKIKVLDLWDLYWIGSVGSWQREWFGRKRRKFITKWNGYFQLGHFSFDNIQSALKLKKHTKVLFCISFFAWFHYVAAKILCFRCQFVSVVVIRGNNEIQNLINMTNKVTKEIRPKNETTIKI